MRTNSGNHAVEVVRVENGRVFVRDPNGSAGSRSEGLSSAVPEARREGESGEYSLSLEEFSRRAMSVQGPAREPRPLGGPVGGEGGSGGTSLTLTLSQRERGLTRVQPGGR